MRAFVAIELPPAVKDALCGLIGRLRATGARATWVKPEAMHLTLRFLGDLSDPQVDRLRALLTEGYAGCRAFTLEVSGVGAFPNARRPSVVWAGAGPLDTGLAEAQAVAERAARDIGVPPETKPFHPHLTVARVKDPAQGRQLTAAIDGEAEFQAGAFAVDRVVLFSSRLTPHGPIHERVQEWGLA